MTGILFVLIFSLWVGSLLFFRRYRIWLFYYLVGVVGAAYLLVWLSHMLDLETQIAYTTGYSVHWLSNFLGVPTRIFERAPDVLLVLVVVQKINGTLGWTMLKIGVESSGLLELCVLFSLILFYPGWSWKRRLTSIGLGAVISWSANVVRLLLIVNLLHFFGKDALVLAHTYVGKIFFFAATVLLYWFLITRPVLGDLEKRYQTT